MAGVIERLSRLIGSENVERDPRGLPRAIPRSDEALALLCENATREGWHVRVEGGGSWLPPDAPADFAVSTRGLARVLAVSPSDLVASAEAGVPLDRLRTKLARQEMWLALDPPGRPDRTLGSVAATATAGPLRQGFGPVRDHVLGCTVATGDGRLLQAGGRVVKNVAGYDLTKLHVGGFGGFGIITAVHLRLRALPETDLTLVARGELPALLDAGEKVAALPLGVALELLSPALTGGSDWTFAARVQGTGPGTEADRARLEAETRLPWERLSVDQAAGLWESVAASALAAPVSIRAGVVLDGLESAIDLVVDQLGAGLLLVGLGSGSLRWTGASDADRLRRLRREAATREIPVTLERAPWGLREEVGHFGAYREGVGALVGRLRRTFDPDRTIAVTLEGRRP